MQRTRSAWHLKHISIFYVIHFLQSLVCYSILSNRCEIFMLLKVFTFKLFLKNQILFTVQKKHWNKPTKTWPKAKWGED